MESLVESFLNPEVMRASWPYLAQGLRTTVELCLIVVPAGLLGGLSLGLLFTWRVRPLRLLLMLFVDLLRSFPPLVLLVLVFYGLPFLGLELPPMAAVALALFLNTSSFYGEIFRAGIESVPSGQWEAARSTGLSAGGALVHVVLPQATRNVLPDLVSNTLEVIKLTSLASVVALPELLRMARVAQGVTFNPTPLVMAAGLYLAVLWPLVRLAGRLENRLRGSP